jgi:dTDP-3-amino-3,4,6-trideoxy-alpha-D-glucose transaminase
VSHTRVDQGALARNTIPFVDLRAQYRSVAAELHSAVEEVLSNCNFILGRQVREFEEEFADFAGVCHAIGVSSGLDALRLALMALDIGSGDEVILPANTYIATALAVSAVGARPVLVDCDASTYNMDPAQVEPAITSRTKAIIPVHLAGQPTDMATVLEISERRHLEVIEDAAQAHGATYRGRSCGSMGAAGCFSFYPGKNLGAAGDGGLVVTNDERLAQRLRTLRNYGETKKYEHVEKGLNARLDTLQAAILRVKLRHLPDWNRKRAAHAERYRSLLSGLAGVGFQSLVPGSTHIYHLFIVETPHRDALKQYLEERGIQTGIHYPRPIHLQSAYADLGYKKGDFPNAEALAQRILSLPMFPELTEDQIEYVCEQIRSFTNVEARLADRTH